MIVFLSSWGLADTSKKVMPKGMQHSLPTTKSAIEKTTKEVVCPVTGIKLNPAKAYAKTVYKGKTYYFCCPGCPEEFKKNPEKFIKK
jgi:YHS domain-containing protein